MGVKGLNTFILQNSDLLKRHKLHDSYVVFDGDNLVFSLYFSKINVICGGDYKKYAEYIRRYLCMFLECNVKPIIVFDGGLDKSEKKLKTVLKRTIDKLLSAKSIAEGKSYNKKILPILSHDVFISILNELTIPFAVADFEADDQVAALANYYKCPVISADSDFYLFNVHNGYITHNSIESTVMSDIDSNGKEYKYLICDIYYVKEFVSYFQGVKIEVLPLFGTLMGNDYVEQDEFDNFFANIELPSEGRMISLLYWLRHKSLSDAINEILQYIDKERQESVKSMLQNVIATYNSYNCNLSHIINQKLCISDCQFSLNSNLTTPCGNSLPLDFNLNYHSGCYSSFFPYIITLHKIILNPQIDDFNSCSSYMCARYIRRVIYGILIRHDVDGDTCRHEKCLASIQEYDRHEARLETQYVEPIFALESVGMLPKINELNKLTKEKAKLILARVLGINLDFAADLPAEWQLLILSINYWLCNSVPCPTEAFLYALIINLIYCGVIKHYKPYQNTSLCWRKPRKINHEFSSMASLLSKIDKFNLQRTENFFKRYLSNPSINRNNPLCLNILHSYSQLQSCVKAAVSLNKLLGSCMKNPDIHRCLNGSLIYNLTKDISSWSSRKLFVEKMFGRETTLFKLFKLLYKKMCQDVPNHYILKNTPKNVH